ncbi:putative restriction endonuclease [Sphingomonas sp. PP-CE-3A-406]|uniref:Uma2 family endonuclease n=1 Tax=Sphingomonas sp. PP-CE-3A-406 TaxID=2135659 RepID=UPI000EFA1D10|nr:Uma2 family endonuclease [Sphingomonas sp. PP-CE-3A-406]RMB53838.1 putative restriction endonuclease [Sphingomonas sp. PP-CE-3A-406]
MNVHAPILHRNPVPLTVDDFVLLKRAGSFTGYGKVELLDGELSGVRLQDDNEPEYDGSEPVRLDGDAYRLLADARSLQGHGKTELLDGAIYAMSPQYRPHGFVKDEIAYRLRRALEALGSSLHVATEQSAALSSFDEPQPDIMLTREPRGEGPIPGASIALICEVSANTLAFDLREKARIYAQAGIPEYWVADVGAKLVHQMWIPVGDRFTQSRDVPFDAGMESTTIPGLTIHTAAL